MAKQYLINFLMRGHADVIEFEVRESDWLRAQAMFDDAESINGPARFLVVDSVEGLAVAISLSDVQLARFPWNPVTFPSDQKHKEAPVHVWLRGREEPMKIYTDEDKDSLSALFVLLDGGIEYTPFLGFADVDGELAHFNAREIVLVTAPLHEVREGHQMLLGDDVPDDAGGHGSIHF